MRLAALSAYGALAARYPGGRRGYVYLKEAYGPRMAFLYGWLSLLVTDPGLTAMLAVGLANYVGHLVPLSTWGLKGVAVAAIVILAAVNMLGVSLGSRVSARAGGPEARPAGVPRRLGLRPRPGRLVQSHAVLVAAARIRRRSARPWPSA